MPSPTSSSGTAPPPPVPRTKSEFHIPSLDGLRAISFLTVFVSHAGLGDIVPGGFGVTIFFFLSGYLITTLMRLEQVGSGRMSLRDFYLRRVLRILPPFYLVLVLATALTMLHVLTGPLELKPQLALFGHITNFWVIRHGFAGQPEGTGVYWSLAVEEHFYLVFPWLFLLLQRLLPGRFREQGALLLVICAAVLGWRLHLVAQGGDPIRTFMGTDTRLDSILYGCVLALAANPMIDPPRVSPALTRWVFFPLGLAALIFCLAYRNDWFRETWRYSIQGVALAPVFVVAMRDPKWGPFPLFNTWIARRLGLLSYSLYLLHQVVIYAIERFALPLAIFVPLTLAISVGAAEMIQRFVEKPCARLRRRLAHTGWMPIKTTTTTSSAAS